MTLRVSLRSVVGLAISAGLFAQPGAPTGPGGGAGTPTSPTPTSPARPGIGTQPGNMPGQSQMPDIMMQRPLVLMGKVMMDDGTAPTDPVTIQLVCHGTPRSVAFTDSRGGF